MLTRVYGTAFFSRKDLDEHLERLERARAATTAGSVRSWGCSPSPTSRRGWRSGAAPGPRCSTRSSRSAARWAAPRGYTEVKTPQLFDSSLWKTSGHWDKYREHMFITESEDRADGAQADELPRPLPAVRAAATLLPRPAGPLLRARAAAPPRAQRHAARAAARRATSPRTTPTSSAPRSRSRTRSTACLEFAFATYEMFGLRVRLELSTRPDNRIGSDELWDRAEGR